MYATLIKYPIIEPHPVVLNNKKIAKLHFISTYLLNLEIFKHAITTCHIDDCIETVCDEKG